MEGGGGGLGRRCRGLEVALLGPGLPRNATRAGGRAAGLLFLPCGWGFSDREAALAILRERARERVLGPSSVLRFFLLRA